MTSKNAAQDDEEKRGPPGSLAPHAPLSPPRSRRISRRNLTDSVWDERNLTPIGGMHLADAFLAVGLCLMRRQEHIEVHVNSITYRRTVRFLIDVVGNNMRFDHRKTSYHRSMVKRRTTIISPPSHTYTHTFGPGRFER